MDLIQREGMLAAAPAAGVIVPATRLVQTLGKQQYCGSVNVSFGSGSAAVILSYLGIFVPNEKNVVKKVPVVNH
jgi:hypothetical protein